jgi:hypothetical protein
MYRLLVEAGAQRRLSAVGCLMDIGADDETI